MSPCELLLFILIGPGNLEIFLPVLGVRAVLLLVSTFLFFTVPWFGVILLCWSLLGWSIISYLRAMGGVLRAMG